MADTTDAKNQIHWLEIDIAKHWHAVLIQTASGVRHRPLAYLLIVAGVALVRVSSLAQSRYREAKFNSSDNNDLKDAAVILDLLKQEIVPRYVDPTIAGHHDLQELSKIYFQISRLKTKIQHSVLNHHVPLYFPEMAATGTAAAASGG